jgi:hypothetical protein
MQRNTGAFENLKQRDALIVDLCPVRIGNGDGFAGIRARSSAFRINAAGISPRTVNSAGAAVCVAVCAAASPREKPAIANVPLSALM